MIKMLKQKRPKTSIKIFSTFRLRMPNNKGGKNYKKSKHATTEPIVYEPLPGQMYARVIRILGNCNVLVYCNDNCERLCHIRGNMRRKVWLGTGDIVLISLRELDTTKTGVERGDICAKFDPTVISRLQQKDKSINPLLFKTIEKNDGQSQGIPDENGFVFDVTHDDDDTSNSINESVESSAGDDELTLVPLQGDHLSQRKEMKEMDDDIDIDNI